MYESPYVSYFSCFHTFCVSYWIRVFFPTLMLNSKEIKYWIVIIFSVTIKVPRHIMRANSKQIENCFIVIGLLAIGQLQTNSINACLFYVSLIHVLSFAPYPFSTYYNYVYAAGHDYAGLVYCHHSHSIRECKITR